MSGSEFFMFYFIRSSLFPSVNTGPILFQSRYWASPVQVWALDQSSSRIPVWTQGQSCSSLMTGLVQFQGYSLNTELVQFQSRHWSGRPLTRYLEYCSMRQLWKTMYLHSIFSPFPWINSGPYKTSHLVSCRKCFSTFAVDTHSTVNSGQKALSMVKKKAPNGSCRSEFAYSWWQLCLHTNSGVEAAAWCLPWESAERLAVSWEHGQISSAALCQHVGPYLQKYAVTRSQQRCCRLHKCNKLQLNQHQEA